MKKINAIIVDDEVNARSLLRNFITDHCLNVNIIDEAEDVKTAVKLINNNEIDLVFLDIEMPNENGFALFEYFVKPKFKTIFCTAYSEYALKAFEVSAVDYILKPVGIKQLKEAVEKLALYNNSNEQSIELLKENILKTSFTRIGVYVNDAVVFYELKDILYFEADGAYTYINHKNGKDLAVKKIKYFEDMLIDKNEFLRVHRSYLVNLKQVKKYVKKEGTSIIFNDNKLIPIARERKDEFERHIKIFNQY